MTFSAARLSMHVGANVLRKARVVAPYLISALMLTLGSASSSEAQVSGINVKSAPYNATGNGTTDDTNALKAAYNAAKTQKVSLLIPTGDYIFTSTLTWDGPVNVIGASMAGVGAGGVVILHKTGDFVGIKITPSGASGVTYTNFNLYRTGTDHSNGIEVDAGTNMNWRLENIDVQSQGGHGLVIRSGKMGMITNVAVSSNGGDGVRVESQSGVDPTATADSCVFTNIVSSVNGGHGFNIVGGNTHFVTGLVSQNNTQFGVRVTGALVDADLRREQPRRRHPAGYDVRAATADLTAKREQWTGRRTIWGPRTSCSTCLMAPSRCRWASTRPPFPPPRRSPHVHPTAMRS